MGRSLGAWENPIWLLLPVGGSELVPVSFCAVSTESTRQQAGLLLADLLVLVVVPTPSTCI